MYSLRKNITECGVEILFDNDEDRVSPQLFKYSNGTFQFDNVLINDIFQTVTFVNPLVLDATLHKDFICSSVTGNTTVNLTNATNGDAGLIELIIDIVGGYTVTLGTMFTKDISGVAINTTASVDNFISWRKVGTDIVYSVAQVQS